MATALSNELNFLLSNIHQETMSRNHDMSLNDPHACEKKKKTSWTKEIMNLKSGRGLVKKITRQSWYNFLKLTWAPDENNWEIHL